MCQSQITIDSPDPRRSQKCLLRRSSCGVGIYLKEQLRFPNLSLAAVEMTIELQGFSPTQWELLMPIRGQGPYRPFQFSSTFGPVIEHFLGRNLFWFLLEIMLSSGLTFQKNYYIKTQKRRKETFIDLDCYKRVTMEMVVKQGTKTA